MSAPTKAGLGVVDPDVLDRDNHTGEQDISTITGLQAALNGKLTAGGFLSTGAPGAAVPISAGVLAVTKTHTLVDTEGAAATDDLDSINGGAVGDLLILGTSSGARDVTVKNGAGIVCGTDRILSTTAKKILLLKTASAVWTMLAFADN